VPCECLPRRRLGAATELLGRGRAGINDASILSSSVKFLRAEIAAPSPTVGDFRFVLNQIAAKAVTPESSMYLRFVKQRDHSRFIRGLYPKG